MATVELMSAYGAYVLHTLGLAVGAVSAVCLALLAAWTLHAYNVYQKYRHLPGPKVANFYSGHARLISDEVKRRKVVFGDLMLEWCLKHGPVFVLFFYSREMVIVCSPEGVKEFVVSAKHPKSSSYKNIQALFGARFMGTGLASDINHSTWAIRRAIVDPAFHRKYLRQSMVQFNNSSDLMVKRLMGKAGGSTEVVMLDELNKVTLDVIAKVSFSCELDIMVDEISPFTDAVRVALDALGTLITAPSLYKYSPFRAHREHHKRVRDCCQRLRSYGEKCIRERLAAIQRGEEVPADTLTYIIGATGQLTHENYKIENMVDDFVTFFVAGQETTANLLTSCLFELFRKQPEVLYRLKNEVESVIGDKTAVAFEDLPKLEYMAAVLKETLRVYPPAGGTTREAVEDVYLHGHRIPAKSTVRISFDVLARLEKNFKDASKFEPDRFMGKDEHTLFTYMPFSLGPRICLGKSFALIEAKVLLCKLLTNFDFSLVPGQSTAMVTHGTLRPEDGCKVTLKPKN